MSKAVSTVPIILLIEEDDDTRPILKHNLINDGFRVLLALDEDDALDRVGGERLQADLILINLVKKTPEEVLSAGRRIREHAKYDGKTPLVVMAEKYTKEQEGTDVHVAGNDWITYLEEHDQLTDLLRSLVPHLPANEREPMD
jgi:DNA-binding response OmpR family regulator